LRHNILEKLYSFIDKNIFVSQSTLIYKLYSSDCYTTLEV